MRFLYKYKGPLNENEIGIKVYSEFYIEIEADGKEEADDQFKKVLDAGMWEFAGLKNEMILEPKPIMN